MSFSSFNYIEESVTDIMQMISTLSQLYFDYWDTWDRICPGGGQCAFI